MPKRRIASTDMSFKIERSGFVFSSKNGFDWVGIAPNSICVWIWEIMWGAETVQGQSCCDMYLSSDGRRFADMTIVNKILMLPLQSFIPSIALDISVVH